MLLIIKRMMIISWNTATDKLKKPPPATMQFKAAGNLQTIVWRNTLQDTYDIGIACLCFGFLFVRGAKLSFVFIYKREKLSMILQAIVWRIAFQDI